MVFAWVVNINGISSIQLMAVCMRYHSEMSLAFNHANELISFGVVSALYKELTHVYFNSDQVSNVVVKGGKFYIIFNLVFDNMRSGIHGSTYGHLAHQR